MKADMEAKACTQCGQTKPLDQFYVLKRARDRRMSACAECWKARQQRRNQLYAERPTIVLPETVLCQTCKRVLPASFFALNRTRARGCQSRCRECHRDKRYGLRPGEYDEQLLAQAGVCGICRLPPPEGKDLEVDHCHTTGRFRGLLCSPCNRVLGTARDSIKVLLAAAEYLEKGVV